MDLSLQQQYNLPSVFFRHLKHHAKKPVFADHINGEWIWLSWEDAAKIITSYALHLKKLGLQKGDTVALMSENSSSWIMADLAIQSIGAVTVPLYPSASKKQTQFILKHAEIKIALLGASVLNHAAFIDTSACPDLKEILTISPKSTFGSSYNKLDASLANNKDVEQLINGLNHIDHYSLSSIIYTSGTTGQPKGVMLSHHNIVSNAEGCSDVVKINHEDCHISFLPLCHAFERTAASYTCLINACKIAFVSDIARVAAHLQEVNPSLIFTVPRVLEKVHTAILNKLHPMPLRFGKLILHYIELNSQKEKNTHLHIHQKVLMAFFKKTFFKKIAHKFGKNLRYIVSGGAALNPDLAVFFRGIDITILQGYGLTEASPVISTNRPDKPKSDTVGPPLFNIEYMIDPDNSELLVKGPSVMLGYYKDQNASKNALNNKGFLKTGDIAHTDEDGHIVITDRIKDIIVSSGGKNIAPSPIEHALKNSPYIENACVIGEKKKYLSVLIVPDWDNLKQWIKRRNKLHLAKLSQNECLNHKDVIDHYQAIIHSLNAELASYQTLKYFSLLEEAFSMDNDTLTPTLKIKRKAVETHYAQQIGKMYH